MGARIPRLLQRVDLHARLRDRPPPRGYPGSGGCDALGRFVGDVRRAAPGRQHGAFHRGRYGSEVLPGKEVYTDLFFHGTHTAATVSSNAVRAAGITSMTTLVA